MAKTINQKYREQKRLQKIKRRLIKTALFLVLLFALAGGLYYLFFCSSVFAIKEISVSGADGRLREDILAVVNDYLSEKIFFTARSGNILLADSADIVFLLEKKILELNKAKMTKNFPHHLVVTVLVREPEGVWCSKSHDAGPCFYFDRRGIIFKEAQPSSEETPSLPLMIDDYRPRTPVPGETAVGEEQLNWLNQIKKRLSSDSLEMKKAVISEEPFRVDIETGEGWSIYFSTEVPLPDQLNALFALLHNSLSANQRLRLRYVDLRIPDRVYYRVK